MEGKIGKRKKKQKRVQIEAAQQSSKVLEAKPKKKKKKKQQKAADWVPENVKRKSVNYPPLNGNELLQIHTAVRAAEPGLNRPFNPALTAKERERLYFETEDPAVRSHFSLIASVPHLPVAVPRFTVRLA